MKELGNQISWCLLLVAVAGCYVHYESPGTRKVVTADVQFVKYPDMTPIANAPAYILEQIDVYNFVTEVLETDDRGYVRLDREYCLTMYVAMPGGEVGIDAVDKPVPFY